MSPATCGCETSPDVLVCGAGCPCRCHELREQRDTARRGAEWLWRRSAALEELLHDAADAVIWDRQHRTALVQRIEAAVGDLRSPAGSVPAPCSECKAAPVQTMDGEYPGLCAFCAWQKWSRTAAAGWEKVKCWRCALGRDCDEHPDGDGNDEAVGGDS